MPDKQQTGKGAKLKDILLEAGFTHWVREMAFRHGDVENESSLYFKKESDAKEYIEGILKTNYSLEDYTVDKIENGYELYNDGKWSYCIEYWAIEYFLPF